MSIFFSKINEYFKNQKIETDFDFNHISRYYKDKTFRFVAKDNQPQNNCFLSYKKDGTLNNKITFDLLKDLLEEIWLKKWKQNNYCFPQYGINTQFDIKLNEKIFEETYNSLKSYFSIFKKNIHFADWKYDWINNLLEIKNDLKKQNKLSSEFEEMEKIIFQNMIIPNIKNYFKDSSEKYLEEYDKIIEWKRIPLNQDYKIFDNKINSSNVKQGNLGTCYFLETISTLSNFGQLLYQLFPKEEINKEGFYEICLFDNGKWLKVLIDDYFPFKKGTKELFFTQPVNNCLYSCFLEKAFAKIKGSYADINGSSYCQAFEVLTGFRAEEFNIKDTKTNKKLIQDYDYEIFYQKINDGNLFACSAHGHAYSILSINRKVNKDSSDIIFQIRNPWSSLDEENKKYFDDFLKKCPEYKIKNENGIFYLNKEKFEESFEKIALCQILFGSSVYIYELKSDFYSLTEKLYFYFEINKRSKISIELINKFKENKVCSNLDAKLLDIQNDKTIDLSQKYNYDNYKEIEPAKYFLIMHLKDENLKNNDQLLKVVIGGNITINFLGLCSERPTDINNRYSNIIFKRYDYGFITEKLFKEYKNIIKVMENEFKTKMDPDSKGFYIESIFKEEFETIILLDKIKLTLQVCCHQKKEDLYITGNNYKDGRVIDKNGKVIKLINGRNIIIFQGNIEENKFDCTNLKLNQELGIIFSKKIDFFKFNDNSVIKSFLHKRELKYNASQSEWSCDFCLKKFPKNEKYFTCIDCNYNLCNECLFIDENDFFQKLTDILKSKNILVQNSDKNDYTIKCNFHEHSLKYSKPHNNQILICNLCKLQYSNEKLFNCNSCDYSLCLECLLNIISSVASKSIINNSIKYTLEIKKEDLQKELISLIFNNKEGNEIFNIIEIYYQNSKLNLNNGGRNLVENFFKNPGKFQIEIFFKKFYKSLNGFFRKNLNLITIDLSNFDTTLVTDMKNIFADCQNLTFASLSNIKTPKVKNMQGMFYDCLKLREIKGLDSIDTSNVENMMAMFANCKELKELNLSKFNFDEIIYLEGMFSGCSKLTKIEGLDKIHTNNKKIKSMYALFNCCENLNDINYFNFVYATVSEKMYMFNQCKKLKDRLGNIIITVSSEPYVIIFPINRDFYCFKGTKVKLVGKDNRNERNPIPELIKENGCNIQA